MKKLLMGLIKGYQKFISPYLQKSCRHVPSCSEYAHQALEEFGVIKGSVLSVWRILRCNPFASGGYDPVVKNQEGINS
jgi:putative membrane protein insertion efficiency factor